MKQLKGSIQLDGFAFHVPGYESSDRVKMIKVACEKLIEAADLGLTPSRIDIGGGYKTAYADPDVWKEKHATERDFMGNVKPPKIYPYAAKLSGPAQLREILADAKEVIAATSAKLERQVMIDIEPGRSLLEQAGITVFRVRAVRAVGERSVVVVDGNSRDLADSFGSEFLVDPLLLTAREVSPETFSAAIVSNTCKEDDYLARRFVPLPFKPVTGDLLVYVNTAGYEMDSKESSFHRLPIPTKVVATYGRAWRFATDKEFTLADCLLLPGFAE
jgi:diaminopimelate decarboxylase